MADFVNNIFKSESVQIGVALTAGIAAGLALRPIPKCLKDFVYGSFLIKYLIVILFALRIFCPVSQKGLLKILIFSFIVLLLFEYLRTIDRQNGRFSESS
jgi:hypothetical protein